MIYGIGIDIISVDKIKSICNRNRIILENDLFTSSELKEANITDSNNIFNENQIKFLASKFAAKEAVIKVVKLPPEVGFYWSDIEIKGKNNISININGNIKNYINKIGNIKFTGGISKSTSYSMAVIIGELK